jgi:hypothetical protein
VSRLSSPRGKAERSGAVQAGAGHGMGNWRQADYIGACRAPSPGGSGAGRLSDTIAGHRFLSWGPAPWKPPQGKVFVPTGIDRQRRGSGA